MKNRLFGIGVILAVVLVALVGLKLAGFSTMSVDNSTIQRQIMDTSAWVQVFSDDFSSGTLDSNKWVTCYDWRQPQDSGCTNSGNFEQEWYMPSQVTIKNGTAVLTAASDSITASTANGTKTFPYRSGMISTGRPDTTSNPKWSATYGYYEARIKFDGGQGVWPAFWLLPTDRSWPPEIDVMEFLGNDVTHVLMTSHWKDANGNPQKDTSVIAGPDFTAGWHTYAINWQPDRIDWYIDDQLKKSVTSNEVPDKPMEIIFNLAVGGILPGNADSTTKFPRTMQIDYVKVFEKRQ